MTDDPTTIETEALVAVTAPMTRSPAATPSWKSVRDGLRQPTDPTWIAKGEFAFATPLTP